MTHKRLAWLLVAASSIVLLALVLGPFPPAMESAPLDYQEIIANETWHGPQTVDTDVVVANGATLTIAGDARVAVADTDPAPYHPGDPDLSGRIEIIVEDGGTLIVESGALFTSTLEGAWAGIHFLPGGLGSITGATIRDARVGITIEGASPTIQENYIEHIRGVTWYFPMPGGWAAGIVISGTSSAQVISNTIDNVYGGWGVDGLNGGLGDPGQPGDDGNPGTKGGAAYGIWVKKGAAPTIRGNQISIVTGGTGGAGGSGGPGGAGDATLIDGGPGGAGGAAGDGGEAYGILVQNPSVGCTVEDNTIERITGGAGNDGGDGGAGGAGYVADIATYHGGYGGGGGAGGDGSKGGRAYGILVEDATMAIQDNEITSALDGGAGGEGGQGGNGGDGGAGYSALGDIGGNGGWGGDGGTGGDGASGQFAAGIYLSGTVSVDVRHNLLSAVITGGAGGGGGHAGNGGSGGAGGHGINGGTGGSGGDGGSGGYAGDSSTSIGISSPSGFIIFPVNGGTPTLARNTIVALTGANGSGTGGFGGHGGDGGDGGAGDPGTGGDGGDGGIGGPGSDGGVGGSVYGISITGQYILENNLVYNLAGGASTGGGTGGNGGNLGDGGIGSGGNGSDGLGGSGGDGGDGGNAGWARDLEIFTGTIEVANNTFGHAWGNGTVSPGGAGGAGLGGAAAGDNGAEGLPGEGFGIYIEGGQIAIYNNIVVVPGVGQQAGPSGGTANYGIYVSMNIFPISLDYNDVADWETNYYNVTTGTHDISEDPRFVDVTIGDYHLQDSSPCIDQGTGTFAGYDAPSDDIDGDTRPQDGGFDIGADENPVGGACTPVTGVTIDGPTSGDPGVSICFTATVSPANASTPIDYTWDPPPDGQGTPYVCYMWTNPGTYTFTVAVSNCNGAGTAQDSHTITIGEAPCVPVTGVTISGPTSGLAGLPYGFTANVSPANASTPIAYTWSSSGLVSGQGTANATYQWSSAGSYDISVEVENCGGTGTAGDDHTINITAGTIWRVFLPLIHK